MKTDIWMPIYIGDYLADTSRLTTEQHGAYLLLLMDYWRKGPLPNNPAVLMQITKMSADAWSIAQATLMEFFELREDGKLHQKRADRELATAVKNRGVSEERARKAAEVRWGKRDPTPSNAPSNPRGVLEECPLPSPLPLPKKQKQKPSRDKREVDPRHQPFKLALQTYWIQAHDQRLPFPWGPADAKQLANLLSATPDLSLHQFQQLLENRLKSAGIIHGNPPHKWLAGVMGYSEPNDRYNKTLEKTNGATGANFRNASKTGRNLDECAKAIAFSEQEERDYSASDEIQLAAGCSGDCGETDAVRG